MKKYYEINELWAKLSKKACSFRDYIPDSATNSYKKQVDYAYELVDTVLDENRDKALYYADMYAKKLAENINKRFKVDASCPSIMIAGRSNFNIKKKEKQQSRLDSLYKEYDYIQNYLEKIKNLRSAKIRIEKQGVAKEVDLSNLYFKVVQNEEINRLQLIFEDKPCDEIRELLKKNGFRWSPKNNAWQRQLTDNALRATKSIIINLKNQENEE